MKIDVDTLVKELMVAIDSKNAPAFASKFAEDSSFIFGNQPPVEGKEAISGFVAYFFTMIQGSQHELVGHHYDESSRVLTWRGSCDYERLDKGRVKVPFCNLLSFDDKAQITEYQIYINNDAVFAPTTVPLLSVDKDTAAKLKGLILSTRPWSFTASGLPVVIAALVLGVIEGEHVSLPLLFMCLIGVLAAHCGANLTNTYYDFQFGCDTKHHADDRTLVDECLTPDELFNLQLGCYAVALAIGGFFSYLRGASCILVVLAGLLLAVGYTAPGLKLKYKGLGDIVIFLCFGPLLTAGVTVALTGNVYLSTLLFSLPEGLITEGILHANNARDIEADKKAGAKTLASQLGVPGSFQFYQFLLMTPYAVSAVLALCYGWWCIIPAVTLPLAMANLKDFQDFAEKKRPAGECMDLLPQKTAQFGVPFGLTLMSSLGLMWAF